MKNGKTEYTWREKFKKMKAFKASKKVSKDYANAVAKAVEGSIERRAEQAKYEYNENGWA